MHMCLKFLEAENILGSGGGRGGGGTYETFCWKTNTATFLYKNIFHNKIDADI